MGYVYLIRQAETDLYKIGHTSYHPKKRLKELQTGNPEKLHLIEYYSSDYCQKIESLLHLKYKNYNVRQEWFRFDLSIESSFLNECQSKEAGAKHLVESKKANDDWDKLLKKRI